MVDILERIYAGVPDKVGDTALLLEDAANEIVRLREAVQPLVEFAADVADLNEEGPDVIVHASYSHPITYGHLLKACSLTNYSEKETP